MDTRSSGIYISLNSTRLGVSKLQVLQAQQKLIDQDQDEERFAFVEGYFMLVCQLAKRRNTAKVT